MLEIFSETEKIGIYAIAKRRPKIWRKFLELAHEIMYVESQLPQLQKELIGAYVSKEFRCDFCHLGHLDVVEALGGPEAKALVSEPSADIKPLFDLADKVAENALADIHVQKFLDVGHSDKAVEDVILVTALFGLANRMVTGFGIEYNQQRDQESSKQLAKGYVKAPT